MAELVGLTASIVSIASAGVKLSTTLYTFAESASRADQDVTDIASDVALTANVLDSVGIVLKEDETKCLASKAALNDADNIIKRCEAVFGEIRQIIEKRTKVGKDGKKTVTTLGRLAWPLKEQKVELMKRRLDSLKLSLSLLLKVLSFAGDKARGKEAELLHEERESIRALHKRHQESLESLSLLEKKLNSVSLDDSETLRGSTNPSRSSTINFAVDLPSANMDVFKKRAPMTKQKTPEPLSEDSDDTIGGSDSGSEDEPISSEDLLKCTKHVQKLLRRIESLQTLVSEAKPARSRRRVHKAYRRFCSKIESDVLRPAVARDLPSIYSITDGVTMAVEAGTVKSSDTQPASASSNGPPQPLPSIDSLFAQGTRTSTLAPIQVLSGTMDTPQSQASVESAIQIRAQQQQMLYQQAQQRQHFQMQQKMRASMVTQSLQGGSTDKYMPHSQIPQIAQYTENHMAATQDLAGWAQRVRHDLARPGPLSQQDRAAMFPSNLPPRAKSHFLQISDEQFRYTLSEISNRHLDGYHGPTQAAQYSLATRIPLSVGEFGVFEGTQTLEKCPQMSHLAAAPTRNSRAQSLGQLDQRQTRPQHDPAYNLPRIGEVESNLFPNEMLNAIAKQHIPSEVTTWAHLQEWASHNPALASDLQVEKMLLGHGLLQGSFAMTRSLQQQQPQPISPENLLQGKGNEILPVSHPDTQTWTSMSYSLKMADFKQVLLDDPVERNDTTSMAISNPTQSLHIRRKSRPTKVSKAVAQNPTTQSTTNDHLENKPVGRRRGPLRPEVRQQANYHRRPTPDSEELASSNEDSDNRENFLLHSRMNRPSRPAWLSEVANSSTSIVSDGNNPVQQQQQSQQMQQYLAMQYAASQTSNPAQQAQQAQVQARVQAQVQFQAQAQAQAQIQAQAQAQPQAQGKPVNTSEIWMEARSLSSSDNGWSTVDLHGQRHTFDFTNENTTSLAILNPSQALHIQEWPQKSGQHGPQRHEFGAIPAPMAGRPPLRLGAGSPRGAPLYFKERISNLKIPPKKRSTGPVEKTSAPRATSLVSVDYKSTTLAPEPHDKASSSLLDSLEIRRISGGLETVRNSEDASPSSMAPTNQNDAIVDDETYSIKCVCGFSEDDGSTVLCKKCDTWQHISCHYDNEAQVLEDHECVECAPREVDRQRVIERQTERRSQEGLPPRGATMSYKRKATTVLHQDSMKTRRTDSDMSEDGQAKKPLEPGSEDPEPETKPKQVDQAMTGTDQAPTFGFFGKDSVLEDFDFDSFLTHNSEDFSAPFDWTAPTLGSDSLKLGAHSHRRTSLVATIDPLIEPPLFINPKQFHRILKRRLDRHRLEEESECLPQDLHRESTLDSSGTLGHEATGTQDQAYYDHLNSEANVRALREYQTTLVMGGPQENRNRLKMVRKEDLHQAVDFNSQDGNATTAHPKDVAPSETASAFPSSARIGFTCSYQGCGETYSRAEHLYRHSLNHEPRQIHHCNFPLCNRSFVRRDLRDRHEARHLERSQMSPPNQSQRAELHSLNTRDDRSQHAILKEEARSREEDARKESVHAADTQVDFRGQAVEDRDGHEKLEDYWRQFALLESEHRERLLIARQQADAPKESELAQLVGQRNGSNTATMALEAGQLVVPASNLSRSVNVRSSRHRKEPLQTPDISNHFSMLATPMAHASKHFTTAPSEAKVPDVDDRGQQYANSALDDYQMQLMLLERQNKIRLLMARQERNAAITPESTQLAGHKIAAMSAQEASQLVVPTRIPSNCGSPPPSRHCEGPLQTLRTSERPSSSPRSISHGFQQETTMPLEANPPDACDPGHSQGILHPVANITSPSSSPGSSPGWQSLRADQLSPAMLQGPTGDNDYFNQGLGEGFTTPSEPSLRTGSTPGGGGSMFPAPSPNAQAVFKLQNGGVTPESEPLRWIMMSNPQAFKQPKALKQIRTAAMKDYLEKKEKQKLGASPGYNVGVKRQRRSRLQCQDSSAPGVTESGSEVKGLDSQHRRKRQMRNARRLEESDDEMNGVREPDLTKEAGQRPFGAMPDYSHGITGSSIVGDEKEEDIVDMLLAKWTVLPREGLKA